MSKRLAYLLGIALTIGLGMWLYHHFCCNCGKCCESNSTSQTEMTNAETPKSAFTLTGKDIDYTCEGNFNFLIDTFKSDVKDSTCINTGIEKLKSALEKNPQRLAITGYALTSEKNNSVFENLGLARANDVKNYFVSKGIPSNIIDIKGEIKDDLLQKENTLFAPINYTLTEVTKEAPKEDFNALKEKINANPMILYFETGQNTINLSDEDRKKVSDIIHYLDNVANANLDITGYTDNTGNRDTNIKLGQDRANFAKNYFEKNGIPAAKIISTSKGPDNPIATNATAEGRAKNRRTEIKIK